MKIEDVGYWWHSITMPDGSATPGHKSVAQMALEIENLRLPNLAGKSVLDIGAWDGGFSFEAEKRGASRVVALDHYVWSIDLAAATKYWSDCKERGVVPKKYDDIAEIWRPRELPGKRGFDTARSILRSGVESVFGDFMEMDLATLGRFDVVLYLGVLYHVHNPFEALKRLATVTGEVAIIETEAIVIPGYEDRAFCEFYETNELNNDVSNWWVPTEKAVLGMCRAAGFRRAEALTTPPSQLISASPAPSRLGRLFSTPPPIPQPARDVLHYRAFIHAYR
jgi:tRNA (mo5U34)-methyltransferase